MIFICSDTLLGNGSIKANGSKGSKGAGAGGRIALDAREYFGVKIDSISSLGYSGSQNGTCVISVGPDTIKRDLYIINQNRSNDTTFTVNMTDSMRQFDYGNIVVHNSSFRIKGEHNFNRISIKNGNVEWTSLINMNEILIDSNSSLVTNGRIYLDSLKIQNNSTLTVADKLVIKKLSLINGSVLKHKKTTANIEYGLEINVEKLLIDSNSKIDVSGCGYLGDRFINRAWDGARTFDNEKVNSSNIFGGTHGGYGAGNLSDLYGSNMLPNTLGSGGNVASYMWNITGGDGGGRVRIDASTISLDGGIVANGTNPAYYAAGCGSGGSILIQTGTLTGNGIIQANGGNGSSYSGGGGRVAIFCCSIDSLLKQHTTVSGYKQGTVYFACSTKVVIPKVKIISPVNNQVVNSSPVSVIWNINDTLQTTSGLLEFPTEGNYQIIRSYRNKEWLTGSDTVNIIYNPCKEDLKPIELNIAGTHTNDTTLHIDGTALLTIVNTGSEPVNTPFEVIVFEDRNYNQMFDKSIDGILGSVTTNSIGINDTQTIPIAINGKVQFVNNLVYAYVDASDTVKESDEKNNIINNQSRCINKPPANLQPNPVIKWEWYGDSLLPQSNHVMGTPVVAQLTDDNRDGIIDNKDIPDIICMTEIERPYLDPPHSRPYLRAINGNNGKDIFIKENLTRNNSSINDTFYYPASEAITVGDIDNDKIVEIFIIQQAASLKGRVVCLENDGAIKWYSDSLYYDQGTSGGDGHLNIADIDGDGAVEIVAGDVVLSNNGKLKWTRNHFQGSINRLNTMSVLCDINMDGKQELYLIKWRCV